FYSKGAPRMVIDSLPPDLGSAPSPAPFMEIIDLLERMVDVDWLAPGEADLRDYLILVEQIQRRMTQVQARIIAAADAQNAWAEDGARSMSSWLRSLTGSSRVAASQAMKLSRALRSDLPETSRALASGDLSREHALILQREATRTDRLLEQLKDPE